VSVLVTARCQGCGACLLTCPEHAIRPAGGHLVVLDRCTGCGECVEVCPVDAIADLDPPSVRVRVPPTAPSYGRTRGDGALGERS